jgi:hypothetical protein
MTHSIKEDIIGSVNADTVDSKGSDDDDGERGTENGRVEKGLKCV